MATDAPIIEPQNEENGLVTKPWANWYRLVTRIANGFIASITIADLTAERLVATDSTKKLVSVATLTSWISGTADEIEVTDNGDGTITIGLPNDVIITNDLTVGNDATIDGDTYLKKDQRLYFDNN